MKTLLISLAAFLPIAGANAAPIVVSSDAVRAEHVTTADLRLDTVAGQRALYGRIRSAASDVCSPVNVASTRWSARMSAIAWQLPTAWRRCSR